MGTDYAEVNYGFEWKYSIYGGPPIMVTDYVKVSQTLKHGQLISRGYTAGSFRAAVDGDTSLYGVITHNLTTTATQASTKASVIPFAPGYVWEVQCGAGMNGGSPIQYLGKLVDHDVPTAGRGRLDTGAATMLFQVVGCHPADVGRTTQGKRLHVTILNAKTQWGAMVGET